MKKKSKILACVLAVLIVISSITLGIVKHNQTTEATEEGTTVTTTVVSTTEVTTEETTELTTEETTFPPTTESKTTTEHSTKKITTTQQDSYKEDSGGEWIRFQATAYCGCASCCGSYGNATASGVMPRAYHTIAVDPSIIPLGTTVEIQGLGTYVAEDTGGAIRGNIIDIYFDSHQEALNFGRQTIYVRY